MMKKLIVAFSVLGLILASCPAASAAQKRILFFTKSSGFEHSVISWKDGRPGYAEKILLKLGEMNGWEFTFSKDGSKFGKDYLAQFDAVFFYTTGDLCSPGTDEQPPMTLDGKQALFDYVRGGKGFVGTHAASDTFHTSNEDKKGPDRYVNHGEKADAYVRFLGGEFIKHGAQQVARNTVTDPKFPGFERVEREFAFEEEWYSLKDFTPDIHVLTVIDAPAMKGAEYQRPPYPTTWARKEGKGRVWFTAMGHREDVWTNPIFEDILVGGIKWALGEANGEAPANLKKAAPEGYTNPPFPEPKPTAVKPKAN
jgi:type 1 glutamine amidotransferase